jgi:hypothetical protein
MRELFFIAALSFAVSLAISSPLVWGDNIVNGQQQNQITGDQTQPDGWQKQQWQMEQPHRGYERPQSYGMWIGLFLQDEENTC